MNILDVLKEEHAAILAAFDALERAIDEGVEPVRGLAYESLSLEMLLHNEIEQEIFYNHLEEGGELGEAVRLGSEEHEEAATLIDELDDESLDDAQWRDTLARLREVMTTHVADEEERIHVLAERELDERALVEMGNEYLQFKVTMKEQMLAGLEKERAAIEGGGGGGGARIRAGASAGSGTMARPVGRDASGSEDELDDEADAQA